MKLAIIGHGYVGLVTAAVFADLGNEVICVGRTKKKITQLNRGIPTFYEPGLEELVERNVKARRLKFTLSYKKAVPTADIVFIAVGTPSKDNGEADLTQVFACAAEIGKNLSGYTVVGCKSTVPVGTNRKVGEILKKEAICEVEFDIASVPEFLREGTAISDTFHPDRVVIGAESKRAKNILVKLHDSIDGKFVLSDIASAELIKYASNAFLATKISFANSIAFLCEKVGADAEIVLEGAGLDKRIGRKFLYPGAGYGGSCLPKDVKALKAFSKKAGFTFDILEAVHSVNEKAKQQIVDKIEKATGGVSGKTVAILGLAFKPNTDDMREAPSIYIIEKLIGKGAKIKAYDPQAVKNARRVLPSGVNYVKNVFSAVSNTDVLVLLTEWREFQQLDLSRIKKLMRKAVIVDGRNVYTPCEARKLGFEYIGMGRK
jgi:UDPglucose 6-dehydrogenase